MITIKDKSRCCGCGACAQRCPQSCIVLEEDQHGFVYPVVDLDKCVDCHLCEKVCPCLNQAEPVEPLASLAAVNEDKDIRRMSSSGGVFTSLALEVLSAGGVVFGARFDDQWNVVHDFTDSVEGLVPLRGSKYVQSAIGDTFVQAAEFLKQGREVLFSGTPCQIAGLKRYLGQDNDLLITVEVVCHGVPSPRVWREYLNGLPKAAPIHVVNFRDKSTGWWEYSVRIGNTIKRHDHDYYIGCFLPSYSLRPSCFDCPSRCGRSGADITLGDLWRAGRMAPSLSDGLGTSLIIVNTAKGESFIQRTGLNPLIPVKYDEAASHNEAITLDSMKPDDYDAFWSSFEKRPYQTIKRYGRRHAPSLYVRIKRLIKDNIIDKLH